MGFDYEKGLGIMRAFVNKEVPTKFAVETRIIAEYMLEWVLDRSPYKSGQFMASWSISYSALGMEEATAPQYSEEDAKSRSREMSIPTLATLTMKRNFYLVNSSGHAEYVENGSPTTVPLYLGRRVTQAVGGKFGRI